MSCAIYPSGFVVAGLDDYTSLPVDLPVVSAVTRHCQPVCVLLSGCFRCGISGYQYTSSHLAMYPRTFVTRWISVSYDSINAFLIQISDLSTTLCVKLIRSPFAVEIYIAVRSLLDRLSPDLHYPPWEFSVHATKEVRMPPCVKIMACVVFVAKCLFRLDDSKRYLLILALLFE